MNVLKKVLIGVLAAAALGLGGAALAGATSGSGNEQNDSADEQVTGAAATKAGAAAAKAVGGADVISVERSDEGGKAAYEVKVKHNGTVIEVNLDNSLGVTAQQQDDDQGAADQGDGDGETRDD
jgi:uncharacterized membrane protein YkoI